MAMTLFDTNIFIDLLSGCPQAGSELMQLTRKRLFFCCQLGSLIGL